MEMEMGLDLSLNLGKKRGIDDAFPGSTTLPLSAANDGDHFKEETGDSEQVDRNPPTPNERRRVLVGWPPVKRFRLQNSISIAGNCEGDGGAVAKTKCVKVKMEGMAIGRKVNLSLHRSYRELFDTLDEMFPYCHKDDNMGMAVAGARGEPIKRKLFDRRTVTYEDGEGDWMFIGDVSWEDFVASVRRLRILR